MDSKMEFEFTQKKEKIGDLSNTQSVETILFNEAQLIAKNAGFTILQSQFIYQFTTTSEKINFTIESDILDVNDQKIAIENYIYVANSSKFVAKAFFVFSK